jgi:hypothetical protein
MGQSPTELLQPPHKQANFIPTRLTSGVKALEDGAFEDGSCAIAQQANAVAAPT